MRKYYVYSKTFVQSQTERMPSSYAREYAQRSPKYHSCCRLKL